jgi:intermediate cleaving peptidase 55
LTTILDGAKHLYTDAYPIQRPKTQLSKFLQGGGDAADSSFAQQISKLKKEAGLKVHPLRILMSSLRVTKSNAEIVNMRLAGRHSGRAMTDAMKQSWSTENELHAFLDSMFRIRGCESEAYVPVIAGGKVSHLTISPRYCLLTHFRMH